ncbi:hypothetical protein D3C84_984980 [compost metagenome]
MQRIGIEVFKQKIQLARCLLDRLIVGIHCVIADNAFRRVIRKDAYGQHAYQDADQNEQEQLSSNRALRIHPFDFLPIAPQLRLRYR